MDDDSGPVTHFALELYGTGGVPTACLTLQDRVGVNVNLVLYAAFVGAARAQVLTDAQLDTALALIGEWHREVVRPLRSVRRRLKTGPSPAPTPATMKLRRELQRLEIEAELVELAELDTLAAALDGPHAAGDAAARATAAITVVVAPRSADDAPAELGADIVDAIAVIARAAALANGRTAADGHSH